LASPAFRPVQRLTVVDDILLQLKNRLRHSRLGQDRRLPSERELARELGVSRPSLREALRTLAHMGVVDTRQGSGTQIAPSGSKVLRAPLEFLLALEQPSIADLLETRELLEVYLAGRAAERRTEEDLGRLRQALLEMRLHLERPEEVTDPDVRFHQAIAAAAHNPLLENMMNCLGESLRDMINAAWPGVSDLGVSQKSHEEIYRAIENRNPRAARRAMTRHMALTAGELKRAKLLEAVPRRPRKP
jgi:GntR family transcriptional repressor for pyruvate dehydrogenase complex